ncbi:2-oxoglutarate dehydrogenase E1 subunit family protein, partial [Actinomadura fibrosa]
MSTESSQTSADPKITDFGANEWLVDELYQKYLEDPNSVDEAWWNFFSDYEPGTRPASVTPASPGAPQATEGAAGKAANGTAAAPPTPGRQPVTPPKAPAQPAAQPAA